MWTRKEQEKVVGAYKKARSAFLAAVEADGRATYRSGDAKKKAAAKIHRLRAKLDETRFDVDNIANQMGDRDAWYRNWSIDVPARR